MAAPDASLRYGALIRLPADGLVSRRNALVAGSVLPGLLFVLLELLVFLGMTRFPTLRGQQRPGQLHHGGTGTSKSVSPGG